MNTTHTSLTAASTTPPPPPPLTQACRLLPPPPYFIHAETFIIYQKQPEEAAENFSIYIRITCCLTILMFV